VRRRVRFFLRLFVLLLPLQGVFAEAFHPSDYLSGFAWYYFADWKLTSVDYGALPPQSFDPRKVQSGDTIYVDYSMLNVFANTYLPRMHAKVILITSNYGYEADSPTPGPFDFLLQDDRIGAWFVQNLDRPQTDKLFAIPIGLANPHWPHGNLELMHRMIALSLAKPEKAIPLYANLTHRPERADCFNSLQAKGVPFHSFKGFESYLEDLSQSVFVASPRGHGLDTHRTWEALLMGCYPIVPSSPLNPLYEDLPVVIVHDWNEVTPAFLQEWRRKLECKTWSREKLYTPYWFAKVRAVQERLRNA
jgi:hypothetical protein